MKDNRATSNNPTQPSAFSLNPKTKASKVANTNNPTTATSGNTNGKGGVVGEKIVYSA